MKIEMQFSLFEKFKELMFPLAAGLFPASAKWQAAYS
jgi:hypothetical protein